MDDKIVYASDGAKNIYGVEGREWELSDVQESRFLNIELSLIGH